jgi:hypothetical protein
MVVGSKMVMGRPSGRLVVAVGHTVVSRSVTTAFTPAVVEGGVRWSVTQQYAGGSI